MDHSKYTPGPWKASIDGEVYSSGVYSSVAMVLMRSDGPANARLIAAAPELLEALEQILDDMGDDGLSACQAAKDQARDAMAKAKGRSNA